MNKDALLLENQFCFSLYRLSKLVTARYRPLLEKLDITYPQYLVMIVLWEKEAVNVKELGQKLSLDSGTLSPLIKRLIDKGLIEKKRCKNDERIVYVSLTDDGKKLKIKAKKVPGKILCNYEGDPTELMNFKVKIDELFELLNTTEKNCE